MVFDNTPPPEAASGGPPTDGTPEGGPPASVPPVDESLVGIPPVDNVLVSEAPSTLETRAHQLAASTQSILDREHSLAAKPRLLNRLKTQRILLHDAYLLFARLSESEETHSYAAEWLLDNYYIVQQAIRQIDEDMPENFYRELPKLNHARLAGYPRVFAIALDLVQASNAFIDTRALEAFIDAYQTITPLTMGEIWAIPVMLRFSLIETLTQASVRALDIQTLDEGSPGEILTGQATPDALVANSVTSLRVLSVYDWKNFFEKVSRVEHTLRGDPAGVYGHMDFATRDRYRKVIEKLSIESRFPEDEIAGQAIQLAQRSFTSNGDSPRQAHVGYYLIDKGSAELSSRFPVQQGLLSRLGIWMQSHAALSYLGAIGLVTLLFILIPLLYARLYSASLYQIVLVLALALIPSISIAVNLVNWAVNVLVPPILLPKLNFQASGETGGIPDHCRTMIVIPALLSSVDEVDSLINQIELHALRNTDTNLAYALLTDFVDAAQQNQPNDDLVLQRAVDGIQALRDRYAVQDRPGSFFLLNRQRRWNPKESAWMGWERKRGKLVELNRLLTSQGPTSFTTITGDIRAILPIRYVITLDADTLLPRGSAARLIGTLAHPLCAAETDPRTGRVRAGYTVLQPRTDILPSSRQQTHFTQIFNGDVHFDLYTHAVSDVYQDLFGEGSYVGKGIYDVQAFKQSLVGQIPENALLSHDLLEGLLGRAGLVSDIVLYEEYPATYRAFTHRTHRWIRGDWQLLPWLIPNLWATIFQSGAARAQRGQAVTLVGRWKIIDNMRRSLFAPALLMLLIFGWSVLPGSAWFWTLGALLVSGSPVLVGLVNGLVQRLRERGTDNEGKPVRQDPYPIWRWLFYVIVLPYEALISIDAVLTSLVRMVITRRKLLEWTPSAQVARLFGSKQSPALNTWREMIGSVLVPVVTFLLLVLAYPAALPVALPFLITWTIAPQLVVWAEQPVIKEQVSLAEADLQQLRKLARRTWLFFEQFVGPADHWLPPDHFQESPKGVIAHRTSATNIGLGLLSTLAAYDFGYSGLEDMLLRLQSTLTTLDQLERYRGHFLNWYDTQTLAPLPARYVSTVDSGNMDGSMIALREGLVELTEQPVLRWQNWEGLCDTLAIFCESVQAIGQSRPDEINAIDQLLETIQKDIGAARDNPLSWAALIETITQTRWPEVELRLGKLIQPPGHGTSSTPMKEIDPASIRSLRLWADRVRFGIASIQREQQTFAPWIASLANPPDALQNLPQGSPLAETWQSFFIVFSNPVRLNEISALSRQGREQLESIRERLLTSSPEQEPQITGWLDGLSTALQEAAHNANRALVGIQNITGRLDQLIAEMDFSFLYDRDQHVFYIGYNLDTEQMDNNHYDLLASEARIASLIAIARRDVPQSHWMYMSRPMTNISGGLALLSWSGTMFEYLMPTLILREDPNTLLHESARTAVRWQIEYGREKEVPWGISESGFYFLDANQNYQYRAFGAPGLGFKRGLSEDLVITPYASLLALPFAPQEVIENMRALTDVDMLTDYGFYEAIDYTSERLPLGWKQAIVKSFMAHHQGMILLQIANYLQDRRMVQRFHKSPIIQSVELLLQEQVPLEVPVEHLAEREEEAPGMLPVDPQAYTEPWRVPVENNPPLVHLLSNGHYRLLITNKGGGYSQWEDYALTRWRADSTLDDWGSFLYIQDLETGQFWTAGSMLVTPTDGQREVRFSAYQAEYHSSGDGLITQISVTLSPDDDVEIRQVRVSNPSGKARRLAVTSYSEVVLAALDTDRRHPAFAKMMVESEFNNDLNALIFHRRPRAANDPPVYLLHRLIRSTDPIWEQQNRDITFESNRRSFLGRGRNPRSPLALDLAGPGLTGETGNVLDPIMALRQEIVLLPRSSITLALITVAGDSRAGVIATAHKYSDWGQIVRVFGQSRYAAEIELRRLEVTSAQLEWYQRLLSALLYPLPDLRAAPQILNNNTRGQPNLWAYGISGDYPILLVKVGEREEMSLLREALQAHAFWRGRGMQIDLVIFSQKESGYEQEVNDRIFQLITHSDNDTWMNRRGGIYLLSQNNVVEEDQTLLSYAARVILTSTESLPDQVRALQKQRLELPFFVPVDSNGSQNALIAPVERQKGLLFDNGLGGFTPDGREYVIYLPPGQATPAPWINVIANAQAGFWVSESGGGFTWAANSGENRLTPWSNDPVSDAPGDMLYLRDEETAEVWSPTPNPSGENSPYLVRHGAGYTTFEHHSHGLIQKLRLFVPTEDPLKIIHLSLENHWPQVRRITVTCYADWVLGVNRDQMAQYILPEYDGRHCALLAHNPYQVEFASRMAFLAASQEPHGLTANRTEFLGRSGSYRRPAGLYRVGLSGDVTPGVDPCAALQIHIDLQPGETREVFFLLGQGSSREDSLRLIDQYRQPGQVQAAFEAVTHFWDDLLGTVQVQTPNPAMDVILNRWLLYQDLSCRVWGRSALYQSSGAFGFRDQLQDVLALIHSAPHLAREQIVRAAQHQFEAGDVLHWWHPPSGRGVRTKISDDLLWLPYVTAEYVFATGDQAVLDETAPFLTAEPLKPGEEDRYGEYPASNDRYSIYEHCRRAIEYGTTAGQHGLPLIGSGDWNDGMNRVGVEGRGESVWLGWFLYAVLDRFARVSRLKGESIQAENYEQQASTLRETLQSNAWDGEWYLRAFYDDDTPLGSAQSEECKIDSIAQSWAILSGAGNPERDRQAMASVRQMLVKVEDQLILLFTPPFDATSKDPGYIKAYPPGVRENGGQYTHAATWYVWALARSGLGQQAQEMFDLLNPIRHAETPEQVQRYRVEPYVVAADVYSQSPLTGQGGWTWYTGSSGWLYRLGLEAILGLRKVGQNLSIDPCIPPDWAGYSITYRCGSATYQIRIENPEQVSSGVDSLELDGQSLPNRLIPLQDDGVSHIVVVRLAKGAQRLDVQPEQILKDQT